MISKDKVVGFNYVLKNDKGEVLDESGGNPFHYLQGHGNIVPGLEEAMEGLDVGAKKDVEVPPEKGYGEEVGELRKVVPKTAFPEGVELKEGLQFSADVSEGNQIVFTVIKVDGDEIHVDGNHPLAGQKLFFSVEVMSVRDATEEEIKHGHVHGPGGHHH